MLHAAALPLAALFTGRSLRVAGLLIDVATWGQLAAGVALLALGAKRSPWTWLGYAAWGAAVAMLLGGVALASGGASVGGWWWTGFSAALVGVGLAVGRLASDAV